jgi:hypothetical protein
MKRFPAVMAFALCGLWVVPLDAQDAAARARQLERQGDPAGALRVLEEGSRQSGADAAAYAEFLDRYNRPEAREVYAKIVEGNLDAARKRAMLRRLVALDLLAGDRASAARHLAAYSAAGGTGLPASLESKKAEPMPTTNIPGPITSFNRMAALSPDLKPDDVLPALARNIVTNGYQAANSQEALEQTEYLKLVFRYLSQARELDRFAGTEKVVKVETCDSAKTGELLKILGYRMRGACGSDVVLETVNASRAFLTIDSGFPLADLEAALRTNRPFAYDYKPTSVSVLYGPEYWTSGKDKDKVDFIDAFMSDPALCRLYLGLSKLDRATADELKKAVPVQRLRAFAHVLDFFGGMLINRNGKVTVPGGQRAEATWAELAGAQPSQGPAFIEKLISKDDGWLNSYFDSLSRIEGPVQAYLTEPERLKRFYTAMRGRVTSPGPARPVFRSNTDLMLLTTRLRMDPNGKPHIPGNIDVWKNLFINHPHGKYDGKLTKAATAWKDPDDVLEALFGLSRKAVENEPLKIFMALSDLNHFRKAPLEPATVDKLARNWRLLGSQYPIFTEVPTLSDQTVSLYIDAALAQNAIKDQALRANSAGTMQALIGLWQILSRNSLLTPAQAEPELVKILNGFTKVKAEHEVFTAGMASVHSLLEAAGVASRSNPHDRMLDLLAGSVKPKDEETHQLMVQEMIRIFEAQKLVSLKLLADVEAQLEAMAKGEKLNQAVVNRLQARMAELQLPRAAMTSAEKNALSFGFWTEKHIESQRKMNLRAMLEKPGPVDAGRLNSARAQLAPLLRDTLVGLNYLYYAPPGAQLLKTNPVFVRSHDFLGVQGTNQTWRPTEVLGTGWPSSAGGRLVGSMSGVAYALAEAEQNFLVPTREQALIWGDLVPQMILSSKVPRFWHVTPAQMHWVGLHIRQGEGMLAESVLDPELRKLAVDVLSTIAAPARTYRVNELLAEGDLSAARDNVTAAELYLLGSAAVNKNLPGPFAGEIRHLASSYAGEVSTEAISRVFGTPKPTLTSSYRPELLNLRTFPTLMGYSSRIMAESWESSILYYAALADELHLSPERLNLVIPEWTQLTVERIFATHLEDWPALLRSLRAVCEDVRMKARKGNGVVRAGAE